MRCRTLGTNLFQDALSSFSITESVVYTPKTDKGGAVQRKGMLTTQKIRTTGRRNTIDTSKTRSHVIGVWAWNAVWMGAMVRSGQHDA